MVSSSIAKTTANTPLSADVISKGTDITKYLSAATTGGNNGAVTDVSGNQDSYIAMKNAQLDVTKLSIDDNGVITSKGSKDTYILNTETNEVTRVQAGEDLSNYLQNVEKKAGSTDVSFAEVKSQYRILTEANFANDTKKLTDSDYDVVDLKEADDTETAVSAKKLYDADGNEVSGMALNKYIDENGNYKGGLYSDSQATQGLADNAAIKDYITKNTADVAADLSFSLHVGADSARTNKISTNIQSMSAAALGIDKLKSTSVGIVDETGDNATDAIDVIADALQKVSTQRSALGAVQNRLEHTIKNLDNIVENTTSAESQIRDTDMATEMVKYSNANILSQAGQSMLAQANQSNQGVLSILG